MTIDTAKLIGKALIYGALAALLMLIATCVSGCQSLDRYQRTYAVNYNADSQTGSVSMTLTPISPPSQTPNIATALNDETISRILALLEKRAEKPQLEIPKLPSDK